mgnify:CR=1 FL=1
MMQEFAQAVKDTSRGVLRGVHTVLPGEIVDYDPAAATAQVRPVMQFRRPDGTYLDYPVLSGVPVLFPQGAGQRASIGFPVEPGDGCLILLAEESLDYWRFSRQTEARLPFDLTNAVCIPGLFRQGGPAAQEASSCGGVVLCAGDSRLILGPEGVEMRGNVTVSGNLFVSGRITSGE